jgi:hypothetical protein
MTLQTALSNVEIANKDISLAYDDSRLTNNDKMFFALFYKQCLSMQTAFIGIDTNKDKFYNIDFDDLIVSCKNLSKYGYIGFSHIGFYLVIRYENLKFESKYPDVDDEEPAF